MDQAGDHGDGPSRPPNGGLEEALTAAVRTMVLASPRLTEMAGGAPAVDAMLEAVRNEWLDMPSGSVHLDLHDAADAKATIVFQPGSGAHARLYFLMGRCWPRAGIACWRSTVRGPDCRTVRAGTARSRKRSPCPERRSTTHVIGGRDPSS